MTAWVTSLTTFREARRDAATARLRDAMREAEALVDRLRAAESAVADARERRRGLQAQSSIDMDVGWQLQRLVACDALIQRLESERESARARWTACEQRRVEASRRVAECEKALMRTHELGTLLDQEEALRDARREQSNEEDLLPALFRRDRGV